MTIPNRDPKSLRPWTGWSALGLTLGGLGASVGVASCCALPILLGSLGVGTAWLVGLARLAAPHRLALSVAAMVLLAGGGGALWTMSRKCCDADAWCARPAVRLLTAAGIVMGLTLVYLGHRYV